MLLYSIVCIIMQTAAQTGSITGTVYNEDKEPATNVIVEVWRHNRLKSIAVPNIDGEYYVHNLPNGKYIVKVADSAYMQIITKVPVRSNHTAEVNLSVNSKTQKRKVAVLRYFEPFVLCAYTLHVPSDEEFKRQQKEVEKGLRRMKKAKKKSYSYTY